MLFFIVQNASFFQLRPSFHKINRLSTRSSDVDVEPTKMKRFLSGAKKESFIYAAAFYPLYSARTRFITELPGRDV